MGKSKYPPLTAGIGVFTFGVFFFFVVEVLDTLNEENDCEDYDNYFYDYRYDHNYC